MTNQNKNNPDPFSPEVSTESDIIHLDYTLKTPEERVALVKQITDQADPSQLTHRYLEILTDYILDARSKAEKKDKTILTSNRLVTVNKRETSYEDLVSKFENGEDGVSNIIVEGNRGVILSPKIEITTEDLAEVPGLRELQARIKATEAVAARATGKTKFLLKKSIIEMRQDQYVLKQIYKKPIAAPTYVTRPRATQLEEHIHIDENQEPVSDALVSFFNPAHISAILCNYDILKEGLRQRFNNDFYYLLEDFDALREAALATYPVYRALARYKIEGKSNLQIQEALLSEYDTKYSVEYISALWRKKIPRVIAEKAKEDYLVWYYTNVERGQWKRCSKCGQVKLAHSRFFSKNNTSKDGFYSVCKSCRNSKNKKGG